MDSKSTAKFSILVVDEARHGDTQYISDGQTYPYVLSAKQNQLFKYELSQEDAGDQLTITMSTILGDPSMYIGLNMIPYVHANKSTYQWSTSSWKVDSIRVQNVSGGIYNILVNAGEEQSTVHINGSVE